MAPEAMGPGGGGTAYLTGYEALFANPANLYIREKDYKLQVSLLQTSGYMDSQTAILNLSERFDRYKGTLQPYSDTNNNRIIDTNDRESIVNRMFRNNRLTGEMKSQSEMYWFGLKWIKEQKSYALALRTRTASRTEMGRGYFSLEPLETEFGLWVQKSFFHQYQALHELSFGYAESFTFLNGLIPQLSEFIIGVAPKIVVSGAHLSSDYENIFFFDTDNSQWLQQTSYYQQSTGVFSDTGDSFQRSSGDTDVLAAPRRTLSDILQPSGVGLGLDIGLTYLVTFGDDFSTIRRDESPTEKSLRLSFSVTDLGAVYQYKNPLTFRNPETVTEVEQPSPVSNVEFGNAPNEYLYFLQTDEGHPLSSSQSRSSKQYGTALPTALNAGALFQINRIKIMGDFRYDFGDSAFSRDRFTTYIGTELRPFPFLPLRAGTRFSSNLPGYYSFGTGLETRYFDVNAAIQLRSKSAGPTGEIAAASIVGIKFYIP